MYASHKEVKMRSWWWLKLIAFLLAGSVFWVASEPFRLAHKWNLSVGYFFDRGTYPLLKEVWLAVAIVAALSLVLIAYSFVRKVWR